MPGEEGVLGNASSRYELLARLAQGGMAEIFLARANGMAGFERFVVLKRIRPEHGEDPRWVGMFLDEARLAAQLTHPNIAQVFDLGAIGDSYFYTMEYVHGVDVLDLQRRCGALGQPVPLHIVLAIALGALSGLSYAHDRRSADGQALGIVHRDVSPANLMVTFEGIVKLLDFGVAKARSRTTNTEVGTIVGKVAYLSPEQVLRPQVDRRSDLFSLGIVLYELLTQVRPFKRASDYETLGAIVKFDPPSPRTVNPSVSAALDRVVMKALAKDPSDRYGSAQDMIDALEAIADDERLQLAPRELKRFMRDLFGTPPEPWRELLAGEESMRTFDGEIELIGPLDESSLAVPRPVDIRGLPADAEADAVPLLPLPRLANRGTPGLFIAPVGGAGATGRPADDLDEQATPIAAYKPVPRTPSPGEAALVAPPSWAPPPSAVPPPSAPIAAVSPSVAAPSAGARPLPLPAPAPSAPVPSPLPPPARSGPMPAMAAPARSGPMPAMAPPGRSGPMPAMALPASDLSVTDWRPDQALPPAPAPAVSASPSTAMRVIGLPGQATGGRTGRPARSLGWWLAVAAPIIAGSIAATAWLVRSRRPRPASAPTVSAPVVTPIDDPAAPRPPLTSAAVAVTPVDAAAALVDAAAAPVDAAAAPVDAALAPPVDAAAAPPVGAAGPPPDAAAAASTSPRPDARPRVRRPHPVAPSDQPCDDPLDCQH
ncbi:MAG: protein kinase [Kofleriaceae bacterium]|nr:protein kinase [Kofleriaceae bacterium]